MATGGSLMGKADSTLTAAAFREGKSNVQKDLGDVYTKREASFKTFQEGISTIFENLGEEDKKEKEEIKKSLDKLNANPGTWDALLEVNDQVANQFKDELKAATTDLEKQKIYGKFNNYSELSKNNNEIFNNVIDLGVTNQLLTKAGSDEQKLLAKMVKDYENNTKITNPSYDPKKADIVYTDASTGATMTLSELQNKVGRKDNTVTTDINTLIQAAATNKSGQPYEDSDDGTVPGFRDDLYNGIYARLNSSDDIANAGIKPVSGMKYSVQDMLMGKAGKNNPLTIELFEILKTLDVDKDGTPGTEADASYVTSTNAAELAKEIMNNDDLYKEVIATTVTNMSGKKAYNISQIKKNQNVPLSFDQQIKLRNQQLDEQTRLDKLNKEQQVEIDAQNTVYSIENEFSAGDNIVGTGARQAQFMPSKVERDEDGDVVEDAFGQPKMTKSYWSLLENGVPKGASIYGDYDSPEALDEIIKFVTKTAGKYGTFQVGVSEKEITKDGVTTKYVYAGNGKWSLKK